MLTLKMKIDYHKYLIISKIYWNWYIIKINLISLKICLVIYLFFYLSPLVEDYSNFYTYFDYTFYYQDIGKLDFLKTICFGKYKKHFLTELVDKHMGY